MYQKLSTYIKQLDENHISEERKLLLQKLMQFIREKRENAEIVKLNFICTHNSRRSHLIQVWAKTMAHFYTIEQVKCYSGGTEETAVYPMVIKTLENQGFAINQITFDNNPTYKLSFDDEMCPMTLFSKCFDDYYNPIENFAAVMTCTDADLNCPVIPNSQRISLPYEDPKISDGTTEQTLVYQERSKQIATEMKYVFQNL